MNKPKRIAFYGKGGIGKSTISSNISSSLAKAGKKVLHIGCDPKADSTRNLTSIKIPTVLELLQGGEDVEIEDIMFKSPTGVYCIESGGPVAGIGCAGIGISSTLELLEELEVFDLDWDLIVYDVLGDVVCGGFAVPMRDSYIDEVYIVTSSEFMSIYAANNILKSVERYSTKDAPLFGGFILNKHSSDKEFHILKEFVDSVDGRIVYNVPLDNDLRRVELMRKTMAEVFETSFFDDLSSLVFNNQENLNPKPLDENGLELIREQMLQI